MPRRKLDRKKNEYIQIAIEPDEKAAFDTWCAANDTTMSQVIRAKIAHLIIEGKKIIAAEYKDNY